MRKNKMTRAIVPGHLKNKRTKLPPFTRSYNDAFYALMLDGEIEQWYFEKTTGKWFIVPVVPDGVDRPRWVQVVDPRQFFRNRDITGMALAVATRDTKGGGSIAKGAERLRRAFPLFRNVIDTKAMARRVVERRRVATVEEALTLFGG